MLIALAFAVALVVGLIVTPVIRHYAHGLDLLDQPGGRKIHQVPIPRLGGLAMALAFGAAIVSAAIMSGDLGATGDLPNRAYAMLPSIGLLVVVGIVDDVGGMRAFVKLGFQIAAALLAFALGLSIELLHLPWGVLELGWLALPVTVLWIVGVINAVNLIDGLDGLASGVALCVLGAFAFLSARDGIDPTLLVTAATIGAAVGFLAYNLHPASIIMGDTGSMFLGFLVAAIAIALTQDGPRPVAPWVPVIALALPIVDTAWAVVRRAASGEAVFAPDRGHIHHQLLRRGLSQRDAMLVLTAVSAALATAAVVVAYASR